MAPVLGIWASSFNSRTFQPTGSYDALATYTVPSGGVSEITFAGLPTGGQYTHLQIRMTSLLSTQNNIYMQVGNGSVDTGSNYAWHELYGDGSSAAAGAGSTQSFIKVNYQTSTSTSYTSVAVIDILDYSSTSKYKTIRSLCGSDANGSGYIFLRSGLWQSSNAISAIKLYGQSGSFNQYTNISVYGVKG
jgi:hypothetical protein